MTPPDLVPSSNPFATRYIRPGAIPYRFPEGESAEILVRRLADAQWRGSIVGPHGTGKTSLLLALGPSIEAAGKCPHLVTLRPGRPRRWWPSVPWGRSTVLIVDGYEQLPRWRRTWLRWRCWQSSTGLLVTSHQVVGLPVIAQTEGSWSLAKELASGLWGPDQSLPEDQIEAVWDRHPGDIREFLFGMYHLYRSQREDRSGRPDTD